MWEGKRDIGVHEDALSATPVSRWPARTGGTKTTTAFRGLDRLLDAALGEISETGTRCPDLLFCIVSIYPGGQTSFSVSRSLLHVLHALDKSLCRRSRGSCVWRLDLVFGEIYQVRRY